MTPKEKAKELYDKFQQINWHPENGCFIDRDDTIEIVQKVISEILELDDLSAEARTYWMEVNIEVGRL
jgi:hypothetical protein